MNMSTFSNNGGGGGGLISDHHAPQAPLGQRQQLNSVRISPASSSSSPSSSSDQSMMLLTSIGKQLQQQQQQNKPPASLSFNSTQQQQQQQQTRAAQHQQFLPTPSSPLSSNIQQQQFSSQNNQNNSYRQQRALSRRNSSNNGAGNLSLPPGTAAAANLYFSNGPKSAFLSPSNGNQMTTMKSANSSNDLQLQLQQQQNEVNNANEKTQRYKTEMCRSFQEHGTCRYGNKCQFAHGSGELRVVVRHPKYKTEMCRAYHSTGFCSYGKRCHFVHEQEEIRADDQPAATLDNKPLSTDSSAGQTCIQKQQFNGGTSSNNSSNSNSCSEDAQNSAYIHSSSLSRLVSDYASALAVQSNNNAVALHQQQHPLSPTNQQNRPNTFSFPPQQYRINRNGMISPSPTPSESSSGEANGGSNNVWHQHPQQQHQPSSSSSSSSSKNNNTSADCNTDQFIQEAARSIFDMVHGQSAGQTQSRSGDRPTSLFYTNDEYSPHFSSVFQPQYQAQQSNNDHLQRQQQQQQLNNYFAHMNGSNNDSGFNGPIHSAESSHPFAYSSNKLSPPSLAEEQNQKRISAANGFGMSSSTSTLMPTSASTSTLLQYNNSNQINSSSPPSSVNNSAAKQNSYRAQQQPVFSKDNNNIFFQRSLSSADAPLSHNHFHQHNNYSDIDCTQHPQQQQQNSQYFGSTTPLATIRHSNTINDFGSAWGSGSEGLMQSNNNNRRRFASTDQAVHLMSALTLGNQQQHNDVFAPSHNGGGENAGFFNDIFSTAAAPSTGLAAYSSAAATPANTNSNWSTSAPRYNEQQNDGWPSYGNVSGQEQRNMNAAVPASTHWHLGPLLQEIER